MYSLSGLPAFQPTGFPVPGNFGTGLNGLANNPSTALYCIFYTGVMQERSHGAHRQPGKVRHAQFSVSWRFDRDEDFVARKHKSVSGGELPGYLPLLGSAAQLDPPFRGHTCGEIDVSSDEVRG